MNLDAVVNGQDWPALAQSLDVSGFARLPGLLTREQCAELVALYPQQEYFRSRVIMARHGFGRGEYQYFSYPLPDRVRELRRLLYPHLAPLANRWNALMDIDVRFPETLEAFLQRCHAAEQSRPTPLLLQYVEGDYNCLHQDLYGELVFPLQVAILLARPGQDFTGGELVMTQTDGTQQQAHLIPLQQGDGVIFTVNQRPIPGKRGMRRVAMRHGVSQVRSGHRHTLGLIFHDAR